jgi:hypothetical protein
LEVSLGETLNHKLRALIRVEIDPGQVILEASGCLTQANYPVLLHTIRRGRRLAPEQALIVDLRAASHIDPEVLMYLRDVAGRESDAGRDGGAPLNHAEAFRLALLEPAELPICLDHACLCDEVQAGLDGEIDALLGGGEAPGPDNPCARPASGNQRTINALRLSEYLEGNLDPAATVRALSDAALGKLADALYRHLDTRSPSFGAHTWYELASEELETRHLAEPEPDPDPDREGQAPEEAAPEQATAC